MEKELKNPDGILSKLEGMIKSLEDRRMGDAIQRGGKTFRDISSVSAWIQTFKDKDMYRYCVDMVTLIMLCAEAYETIAEGMTTAVGAHKAGGRLYGTKMAMNVFNFTLFFSSPSLFSRYDILQVPINLGSREITFFCEIYQV